MWAQKPIFGTASARRFCKCKLHFSAFLPYENYPPCAGKYISLAHESCSPGRLNERLSFNSGEASAASVGYVSAYLLFFFPVRAEERYVCVNIHTGKLCRRQQHGLAYCIYAMICKTLFYSTVPTVGIHVNKICISNHEYHTITTSDHVLQYMI